MSKKKNDTNELVYDRDLSEPDQKLKLKKPGAKKKAKKEEPKKNDVIPEVAEENNQKNENSENKPKKTPKKSPKKKKKTPENSVDSPKRESNAESPRKENNAEFPNKEEINESKLKSQEEVNASKVLSSIKGTEENAVNNLLDQSLPDINQNDNNNNNKVVAEDVDKINLNSKNDNIIPGVNCEEFHKKHQNCDKLISELQEQVKNLTVIKLKCEQNHGNLQEQVDNNNKTIKILSATNEKQKKALEKFSNELNEQFNKIKVNQLKNQQEKSKIEKSKKSYEDKISLLEKELKNKTTLIQILQRDNDKLKLLLDTVGDYKKKMELIDEGKLKDQKNEELISQLEELKKESSSNTGKKSKIEVLQLQNKELNKENQENRKEIKATKKLNMELEKKVSYLNIQVTELNKKIKEFENPNRSTLTIPSINKYKPLKAITENKKNKSPSKRNNMSISNPNIIPKGTKEENFMKIFTEEERNKIEKYFNDESLFSDFIRKISILENCKNSLLNKHKLELKTLNEKIEALDDQIEYLNLKNKESESRLKIFQCELNESKSENKNIKNKLLSQNQSLEIMKMQIKEKNQENNILANQLNDLRNDIKFSNKKNKECKEEKTNENMEQPAVEGYEREIKEDDVNQQNEEDEHVHNFPKDLNAANEL